VYAALSIADHLILGARLNPDWDPAHADGRVRRLALNRRQRAGRLSRGQRARLALTPAVARHMSYDEMVAARVVPGGVSATAEQG
jgi:ABC-2 type transport system ATP-binding protein